jgi:glutamate dehydrogenase
MSSGSRTTDQSNSDTSREDFVEHYFEHLAREDAVGYQPTDLRQRAFAHRDLAETREPGTAAVSVMDQGTSSIVMIVTDDMPFLVDSVTAELVRQDAAIQLVVHPTFLAVREDESYALTALKRVPSTAGASSGDTAALPDIGEFAGLSGRTTHIESWISVEVARLPDAAVKGSVIDGLHRVLGDVRSAVEDWPAMRRTVRSIEASLDTIAGAEDIPDLRQAQELLRWLDGGNFTFLGYKEYELVTDEEGADALRVRDGSGLGLLRHGSGGYVQQLTAAGRAKARERRRERS